MLKSSEISCVFVVASGRVSESEGCLCGCGGWQSKPDGASEAADREEERALVAGPSGDGGLSGRGVELPGKGAELLPESVARLVVSRQAPSVKKGCAWLAGGKK